MKKNLVIIGGGGHSAVAHSVAAEFYSFIEHWDDNPNNDFSPLQSNIPNDTLLFIGIGNNEVRKKIALEYQSEPFAQLISSRSVLDSTVTLGEGTLIMPGAIVNARANIGQHVILNTGSVVEHDCVVEDYVHLSPNATLAGGVRIESGAWIGAGAVVIQGVRIGQNAVVGAGAVVLHDVPNDTTVVGNPARILKGPTKPLVLYGLGTWASEIEELVRAINRNQPTWDLIAGIDDGETSSPFSFPVFPDWNALKEKHPEAKSLVVCISNPEMRSAVVERLREYPSVQFENLIHPNVRTHEVEMGTGNIIAEGTILSPKTRIGDFNVINFNGLIAHDAQIGSFNTLAPRAQLSGGAKLGNHNELGTSALLLPGVHANHSNRIGALCVLDRNINDFNFAFGNPARIVSNPPNHA
jgi:acetyltransferase EpsM